MTWIDLDLSLDHWWSLVPGPNPVRSGRTDVAEPGTWCAARRRGPASTAASPDGAPATPASTPGLAHTTATDRTRHRKNVAARIVPPAVDEGSADQVP
jgi:hypothetical protein